MEFKIPFFEHDLGESEIQSIREVVSQPILTTGEFVRRFEEQFSDLLGCSEVIGLTSCTAALHLALVALDVGPGDEVITTPLTFIATVTSIVQAGATPVFVDVEEGSGNIDVDQIESAITDRTKAVMPVHLYGNMVDMRDLRSISDQYGLSIIEDSAHCIEGSRDGIRPAELGDVACFSFYATKSITCGEGGAVATNDKKIADAIRLLRLHGMTLTAEDRAKEGYKHWDMAVMGWKYNMSNLDAAFLLPQLERVDVKHKRRKCIAKLYEEKLETIPAISLPRVAESTLQAHHLFPIYLEGKRDQFIENMQSSGIGLVVNYRPVHLMSYLRDLLKHNKGDFPNAEKIGDSVVSLPFYPGMTEDDVDVVVQAARNAVSH